MDLFTNHLSKKEQLLIWCKQKRYIRTSEIIKWGSDNFSNDAARNARYLAEEGKLKRLSESDKRFRGFKTKEGIYESV